MRILSAFSEAVRAYDCGNVSRGVDFLRKDIVERVLIRSALFCTVRQRW